MATEEIKIITTVEDKGGQQKINNITDSVTNLGDKTKSISGSVNNLGNSLTTTSSSAGKMSGAFGGLIGSLGSFINPATAVIAALTAISAAVVKVVKEISDFAKEGLQLAKTAEGVKNAFNALSELPTGYLDKIRESTGRLISDFKLMQATVQGRDFGIGFEQLNILLQFAQAQALRTGQSFEKLSEDIITAVGRGSVQIFDNFGISISQVNQKMSEGFTKQAAMIALVEERLKNYGKIAETNLDIETRANNERERTATRVGELLLPFSKFMAFLREKVWKVIGNWVNTELPKIINKVKISVKQWVDSFNESSELRKSLAGLYVSIKIPFEFLINSLKVVLGLIGSLASAIANMSKGFQQFLTRDFIGAAISMGKATQDLVGGLLTNTIGEFGDFTDRFKETVEQAEKLANAKIDLSGLNLNGGKNETTSPTKVFTTLIENEIKSLSTEDLKSYLNNPNVDFSSKKAIQNELKLREKANKSKSNPQNEKIKNEYRQNITGSQASEIFKSGTVAETSFKDWRDKDLLELLNNPNITKDQRSEIMLELVSRYNKSGMVGDLDKSLGVKDLVNSGMDSLNDLGSSRDLLKEQAEVEKERVRLSEEADEAIFKSRQQLMYALSDLTSVASDIFERGTNEWKSLQIASATIDTYAAASRVLAQQNGGAIARIAAASAIIAAGLLNVRQIVMTDVNKNAAPQVNRTTPNMPTLMSPIQETNTNINPNDIDRITQDQRVYILESDIQKSNKKVQVQESKIRF